jgi:hypothetical protein
MTLKTSTIPLMYKVELKGLMEKNDVIIIIIKNPSNITYN